MVFFNKDRSRKDGLGVRCRDCNKVTSKTWKEDNPIRTKELNKSWREDNKEYKQQCDINWREDNKEYKQEYDRQYRTEHQEQLKQHLRDNAGAANARTNLRRAKKIQATPKWIDCDKITTLYEKSKELSEKFNCHFHVDHIIPLISNTVCGLHCWDNLQLLDQSLNCSKNNNYQIDW